MPRQLRIEYPGAIYHVMNRGDRREAIFQDDVDRKRFVATLSEACAKTGWQVHAYPTLQMNVTAGTPYYYTVQVDNTNYMATTNWTAYTSSTLTANLGTNEGWHELWVGLKGYATNSTVAWQWKRLKFDTTPPTLFITGPTNVNGIVDLPLIQLTGYSPEDLGSYSYDLTNACGLVTNQQVLVLDRYHDATTWEFTTNFFQAFDIPLTNGVNKITLHATDLAGNATTLVTNLTLSYAGKTNPPVATFTMTAYESTDQQPDGSYGNP